MKQYDEKIVDWQSLLKYAMINKLEKIFLPEKKNCYGYLLVAFLQVNLYLNLPCKTFLALQKKKYRTKNSVSSLFDSLMCQQHWRCSIVMKLCLLLLLFFFWLQIFEGCFVFCGWLSINCEFFVNHSFEVDNILPIAAQRIVFCECSFLLLFFFYSVKRNQFLIG